MVERQALEMIDPGSAVLFCDFGHIYSVCVPCKNWAIVIIPTSFIG